MDSIKLKNLEIPCIIGIYPHERDNIQSIYLDVEVYTDESRSETLNTFHDITHRDKGNILPFLILKEIPTIILRE